MVFLEGVIAARMRLMRRLSGFACKRLVGFCDGADRIHAVEKSFVEVFFSHLYVVVVVEPAECPQLPVCSQILFDTHASYDVLSNLSLASL